MKILFLGYTVPKVMAGTLSGASVAGNKMQYNVLKHLAKYDDIELLSLTLYPVNVFPKEKRAYIKKETIDICENVKSLKIPFINLPVIKQFSQTFSMYKQAKKIVKKNRDIILFSYNLFPQIGLPLVWLKNKYGCKNVCLLADLPADDKVNRKSFSKFLRKWFDKLTIYSQERCDNFILLNSHVKDYFNISDSFIVVDGGVDEDDIEDIKDTQYAPKIKNVVYTGAYTSYSGVENIVNAMKYVQSKDVILDIYGGGELADKLENQVKNMDNVNYHGWLENNAEVRRIQREAWLLVNPRVIDNLASRVTFPSKIFEYMLSGTPILSTKLLGFAREYEQLIIFSDDDSPEKLAEKIDYIRLKSLEELREIGRKTQNFVLRKRNWCYQCKKIVEFIKNI